MKKGDISEMIQKLKAGREETPNVASITNAPARKMKSEVSSIHKAKEMEFPLEFADNKSVDSVPQKMMKKAPKKAVKMPEPKKAEPKKAVAKKAEPPAKGGKGSEEMKAKMAAIRAKKGKKE